MRKLLSRSRQYGLLLGALLVLPAGAQAAGTTLLGYPGLLQVPTARLYQSGSLLMHLARHQPYSSLSLSAQAFPWLFATIRYTSIDDRPYGPDVTDQSYKDKGFDLSLQLLQESEYLPAVVLGLIDIGGTGLFGSEYLVASRRFGDFDFSLGLGWGRLGSYADFGNPLGELDERFDQRDDFDEIEGGSFTFDEWFSGPSVAVFGGVEWRPGQGAWSFQLDYDGNRYDRDGLDPDRPDAEAAAGPISAPSRWNAGIKYRPWPGVELGLSYIRGNRLSAQVNLVGLWGREEPIETSNMLPVWEALLPESYRSPTPPADEGAQARAIEDELWQWKIYPHAMSIDEGTIKIWQSNNFSREPLEAGLASARIALSRLPDTVGTAEVSELMGGLPLVTTHWSRADVDAAARADTVQDPLFARTESRSAIPGQQREAEYAKLLRFPTANFGINPALRSNIGGPGGFWLSELQLKPFLTLQITPKMSVTATIAGRVVGNLDDARARTTSKLPNVRSLLERYQSEGPDIYIDQLEWNSLHHLAPSWYGRISAGIFEEMYGGIAGEVLWRPAGSRLAMGLNLNRVQQRDFEQRFGFFEYRQTTGHLTAYWNTPWSGLKIEASIGQYLAGDRGGTLRASRRFANGFEVGAFATKTNVSAEEFGEGSFDKGVFFKLPLQVLDRWAGTGRASFDYAFLTRDGGQKVDDGRSLYELLDTGSWYGH